MATETAVDVVMPQMGVSVSEGTITRWLKQEGEQIEADEPLLEISTDKVDTEVPSPASGTLTQILVQEGETVDVGTKLGQIGGAAAEAPAAEAAEPEAPTPAAEAAPAAGYRRGRGRSRRGIPRRDSGADRAGAVCGSARGADPERQRQGIRVTSRSAHRRRARDRPVPGARHRLGRPRDEEGHPRLRRVRRRAAGRRSRRPSADAPTAPAAAPAPAPPAPAAPARRRLLRRSLPLRLRSPRARRCPARRSSR